MGVRLRIATTIAALALGACGTAPVAHQPSVADLASLPEAIERTPPVLPLDAVAKRQDGFVVVELELTRDGTVAAARVLESAPPGLFDQAALEAVKKWRFEPTLVDGKAVPRTITQRLDFVLGRK